MDLVVREPDIYCMYCTKELMHQFKKIILQLFEYLTTANKKNIIYFGADPDVLNISVNNLKKLISYQGNFSENYYLRQVFFMDKMTIRFIIFFCINSLQAMVPKQKIK